MRVNLMNTNQSEVNEWGIMMRWDMTDMRIIAPGAYIPESQLLPFSAERFLTCRRIDRQEPAALRSRNANPGTQ